MKYLFILNDPPYGTERSYNALRLAKNWPAAAEAIADPPCRARCTARESIARHVPSGHSLSLLRFTAALSIAMFSSRTQ